MSFFQLLQPEFVTIDGDSTTADQILTKIAENAVKSPLLQGTDPKDLKKRLNSRERQGSTGLGRSLAIPHCTVDNLSDFVVGVVMTKSPIEFKALDKKPVNLFFYIIGAPEHRNRHIQLLSSISQIAREPKNLDNLINTDKEDDLFKKVRDLSPLHTSFTPNRDRALVQVVIQEEKWFDDILEVLAGIDEGSVAVIEGANAGRYLNATPLFSSWWGDNPDRFLRIIQAVIPKENCNNAVRMINMVRNTLDQNPGVMITITDLAYASGSLNF